MTIAQQCRERLKQIHESGGTKFTCYDLLSKFSSKKELSGIHSFISDRCNTGEIAPIMDGGEPKKVKPTNTPAFIHSKTLVRVYEFKSYGFPDKKRIKKIENSQRAKKAKIKEVAISNTQRVWGDIWPELFVNPYPLNLEPSVCHMGD